MNDPLCEHHLRYLLLNMEFCARGLPILDRQPEGISAVVRAILEARPDDRTQIEIARAVGAEVVRTLRAMRQHGLVPLRS